MMVTLVRHMIADGYPSADGSEPGFASRHSV